MRSIRDKLEKKTGQNACRITSVGARKHKVELRDVTRSPYDRVVAEIVFKTYNVSAN